MLDPVFVGLIDAAKFIGCGRSTFYKLIASGKIKAVKQGRRTLVSVSSLREYAANLPPYDVVSDAGGAEGSDNG